MEALRVKILNRLMLRRTKVCVTDLGLTLLDQVIDSPHLVLEPSLKPMEAKKVYVSTGSNI